MGKRAKRGLRRALCLALCVLFAAALAGCGETKGETSYEAPVEGFDFRNEKHVNRYGRTYTDEKDGSVHFDYTFSGFEVRFFGTSLTASLRSSEMQVVSAKDHSWVNVYVDGAIVETSSLEISSTDYADYELVSYLPEGYHTVKVLKRTEVQFSTLALNGLTTDGYFVSPPQKSERKIEVYGDSITCGYGSVSGIGESGFRTSTEDGTRTYAGLAAQWLHAQLNVIAYSGWRLASYWEGQDNSVVPAVYDRIYSPLAGVDVAWDMSEYVPDVVIVNLGTNDYAQCLASPNTGNAFGEEQAQIFVDAYKSFVGELMEAYPGVHVFLCNGAMLEDTIPWEKDVVKELDSDHVHYVRLHKTQIGVDNGTDGHPHWTSHYESAGVLYTEIKNVMGW